MDIILLVIRSLIVLNMVNVFMSINPKFLLAFGICRDDVIAQIYYARRLAEKLYPVARMVDLHGGHLVSHERMEEVHLLYFMGFKASHNLQLNLINHA